MDPACLHAPRLPSPRGAGDDESPVPVPGAWQGCLLGAERKARGYRKQRAAATACLFPSGEPSASLAILSVFICLSACVLLYLLMCLSRGPIRGALCCSQDFLRQTPARNSAGPYPLLLQPREPYSPCEKQQKQFPRRAALHSLHSSLPRPSLIISRLVPEELKTLTLHWFCAVALWGSRQK